MSPEARPSRRPEQAPDITQPDVLAGLLDAGRIPFMRDVVARTVGAPPIVFHEVWIPPAGTSSEQGRWDRESFSCGGESVYDTPKGTMPARLVMLGDEDAKRVRAQIEEKLRSSQG